MRSVRPHIARAGLLAVCGLLLAGSLAGCTTTQETAARKQARAKRILEAREHKDERHSKADQKGSEKR